MSAPPTIPDPALAQKLTPTERLLLRWIADGWTHDEMAEALSRSKWTIRFHIVEMKKFLGISRPAVLVRFAVRARVVEP